MKPDVITALTQKRSQLHKLKRQIEEETECRVTVIDMEIAKINKAIEKLNDAIGDLLCSSCHGTGSVRRCDAAGQMEDVTCPTCNGTGVATDD